MTNPKIKDQLESLVDSYGIRYILAKLVDVCHEKEEHVRSNWQDHDLANQWLEIANKLYKLSTKIYN